MTLSTGSADMDAIVSGGDAFLRRHADFQSAAANYKKADSDLNLGKAAHVAHAEAMALLAQAKETLDAANAEAERIVAAAQ